jgi:hypothetical protein
MTVLRQKHAGLTKVNNATLTPWIDDAFKQYPVLQNWCNRLSASRKTKPSVKIEARAVNNWNIYSKAASAHGQDCMNQRASLGNSYPNHNKEGTLYNIANIHMPNAPMRYQFAPTHDNAAFSLAPGYMDQANYQNGIANSMMMGQTNIHQRTSSQSSARVQEEKFHQTDGLARARQEKVNHRKRPAEDELSQQRPFKRVLPWVSSYDQHISPPVMPMRLLKRSADVDGELRQAQQKKSRIDANGTSCRAAITEIPRLIAPVRSGSMACRQPVNALAPAVVLVPRHEPLESPATGNLDEFDWNIYDFGAE